MFFLTLPPSLFEHTASVLSLHNAQSERPAKPNTFWILGPFGVEHQLDVTSTVGAYLNFFYKDEGDDGTTVGAGLGLEYLRFSAPGASGFGYGARAILGDGFALGPSLFYVTRPSEKGVAFRVGATFPIGSNFVSFLPELGIGFRF